MKNGNNVFTATMVALAFAVGPVAQAGPRPDGGPITSTDCEPSPAYSPSTDNVQLPVVTIYGTDNVPRGKTGSFVLNMKPALLLGGMYVKFSLCGTAVEGVDYVAPVSPAYIGPTGYGVIQIKTLPDPRGSSVHQAYSVVITLQGGAGYSVGKPNSAIMWIEP